MEQEKTNTESLKTVKPNGSPNGRGSTSKRLNVLKTYKLYIDGKFPRTESGRYYTLSDANGQTVANICRASRKDFREAVVAARKAQHGWSSRSAYNRSQILYRIAEMLEGRRAQFREELMIQGAGEQEADHEISVSVDRLVYFAGWADKYAQVFSSVNPVESSHFNFSVPEPMGVIAMIAPHTAGLAGIVSLIAPAITGGNSVVILAGEKSPLTAVTLGEVLHSSDLPGGVVNILTGYAGELAPHFSTHMDVNAIAVCDMPGEELRKIREHASVNVKRVLEYPGYDWFSVQSENPYMIMDMQEIKTTWHPIGQ